MVQNSLAEFQGNQNENSAKSRRKEGIFPQNAEDGADAVEDVFGRGPSCASTTKTSVLAGVDGIPTGIPEDRVGIGDGARRGGSGGGGGFGKSSCGVSENGQLTLVSMTTEAANGNGVARRTTNRRNGGIRRGRMRKNVTQLRVGAWLLPFLLFF